MLRSQWALYQQTRLPATYSFARGHVSSRHAALDALIPIFGASMRLGRLHYRYTWHLASEANEMSARCLASRLGDAFTHCTPLLHTV